MPRHEAANAVTVGDLARYHLRQGREPKSVQTLSPVSKQPVIRGEFASRCRVKQAQDEVGAMGAGIHIPLFWPVGLVDVPSAGQCAPHLVVSKRAEPIVDVSGKRK
jgi:hypothetical protein